MNMNEIPTVSGVYVFRDPERVIYVGSAVNMRRRVSSHPHRHLASSVDYVLCSESALVQTEQSLIDLYRPHLNKAAKAYRKAVCKPVVEGSVVIAVNLTEDDNALLLKAKGAFESRTGVTIPTTEAIRLAIKALAKEEGV